MGKVNGLTPKQQRFVDEYLVDLNATQAAIRAGYSAATANKNAARMMVIDGVREAIAARREAISAQTGITTAKVLQRFWAIATADTNELIEYRRHCCRCCYGNGNRYQRTRAEMERARAQWQADTLEAAKKGDPAPAPFDEAGGIGYDRRRPPNPDCQECFGDGVGEAFAKDTRSLSPEGRCLYAGVKVTKDGMEVKAHDQHAALVNVGKHLGMFEDQKAADVNELLAELLRNAIRGDVSDRSQTGRPTEPPREIGEGRPPAPLADPAPPGVD